MKRFLLQLNSIPVDKLRKKEEALLNSIVNSIASISFLTLEHILGIVYCSMKSCSFRGHQLSLKIFSHQFP